jgi:40-residue YVTN family beta-propeller repeat/40-residue YVTN family beta-propeller repeat
VSDDDQAFGDHARRIASEQLLIAVSWEDMMAASFAYVTTAAPVAISKIETSTNTVVATIDLGDTSEIAGLAVTPNGARAYVATNDRGFHGTIKVLDTAANTVVATIRSGFGLNGITVAPDGKRAYVTDDRSLFAIDTMNNNVVAAVQFDSPPVGVATDGKRVYVPNAAQQAGAMNLRVVDASTNAVVATAPLNGSADGIALTPDGTRLYLSTSEGGGATLGLQVIDTATNKVTTAEVPGTGSGHGVVVAPDGKRAYYLHGDVPTATPLTLSTIDTATNKGLASLELEVGSFDEGEFLIGMAVTPDGKHLYLANPISRKVSVIDTATNSVSTEIDVGGTPVDIAISA